MLETRDLELPTRHGAVRARLHRPASGTLPGLVYLHGGGWTLFSIDTHDRVMREYASRAGCCVIGVDYALSPERKFPVALEQVLDAVAGLVRQGDALGIDAARIAVGGDSAGANLSVAASLVRRDAGALPPLCAMLLNYGAFVTGCSEDACRRFGGPEYMLGCEEMDRYWRNYMRDAADARDPLVCPLRASLAGLPPAFLAIAECDVLAEQNRAMANRLAGAGVPVEAITYPGASHSFIEAVSIAAVSDRALQDGSEWLRRAFGTAGRETARHGMA
jgi:acetyl esterase